MAVMQNTYTPESMARTVNGGRTDWSAEITPAPRPQTRPMPEGGMGSMMSGSMQGMGMQMQGLNMHHGQNGDIIETPTDLREAYLGSLKAMLVQNKGNFVVATFLIGTQGTVSWEGVLYEVGNDFVTIYQPGRDRYIVCDIYSLKYIEFYDPRRCASGDRMTAENSWAMPMR